MPRSAMSGRRTPSSMPSKSLKEDEPTAKTGASTDDHVCMIGVGRNLRLNLF